MDSIDGFLSLQQIIALRKTKSGEHPTDIRPMIHHLCGESIGEAIAITFRCSQTEKETLKPDLLLQTLATHANASLPAYRLCRQQLLTVVDGRPINLIER